MFVKDSYRRILLSTASGLALATLFQVGLSGPANAACGTISGTLTTVTHCTPATGVAGDVTTLPGTTITLPAGGIAIEAQTINADATAHN